MSEHTPHAAPSSGEGKPSADGKFKAGQSGNPKGRPKKKMLPATKLTLIEEGLLKLFGEEAGRMITVTEGGRQRTLTAFKAVLRSTFNSAIKGSAHAQRTILQIGIENERREQQARAELLQVALSLKQALKEHLAKWVAAGRDPKEIAEHPDDVEIDFATGNVRIWLPFTDAAHNTRAEAINVRDKLIKWIARAKATLAEEGDDELVQWGLDFAREWLPKFNEVLPPRLRRERLSELPPSDREGRLADLLFLPGKRWLASGSS